MRLAPTGVRGHRPPSIDGLGGWFAALRAGIVRRVKYVAQQTVSPATRIAGYARAAGVAWAVAGAAALLLVQLAAWPYQNPVTGTVSGMVFAPGGRLLMPLAGACSLVALIGVAARSRFARDRAAITLWAVALATASIFPTDPPGTVLITATGQVHRWAAAVMFVVAPLAGWWYSGRRARAAMPGGTGTVRALSLCCGASAVANLVVQLPKITTGTLGELLRPALHYGGLTERLLIGLMFAQLIAMVVADRRAARVAGAVPAPVTLQAVPSLARPVPVRPVLRERAA